MGKSLFQASQQWQVNQWRVQGASQKKSVSLLQYSRLQVRLLSQEVNHNHSQELQCFSNCFQEILRKIESDHQNFT